MHVCKHTSSEKRCFHDRSTVGMLKLVCWTNWNVFTWKYHCKFNDIKDQNTFLCTWPHNQESFPISFTVSLSGHHSRSKCLPSLLPMEQSILLKLMWGRHSSKPLNPSSLSSALTFMRLRNAGKWLSLGHHVLSLYANAMLRWLYEGPPLGGQSLLGALARVWWRFSIFYTFKWLRRPRLRCPDLPFDLLSRLTRWISM